MTWPGLTWPDQKIAQVYSFSWGFRICKQNCSILFAKKLFNFRVESSGNKMMHQHNKLATPSKSCRKVKLIANLPQRVVLNGDFNSDCRIAPSILEKKLFNFKFGRSGQSAVAQWCASLLNDCNSKYPISMPQLGNGGIHLSMNYLVLNKMKQNK